MATGRKFLLSDAVVLVAATAIGFAIARPYYQTIKLLDGEPPIPSAGQFSGWIRSVFGYLVLAAPIATAWSLAIVGLRLRKPRDRWRRLVREPGLVAGLMAVAVLAVRLVGFATMYARVRNVASLSILTVRHGALSGSFRPLAAQQPPVRNRPLS